MRAARPHAIAFVAALFGSAIGVATGWTIVGRHRRNEAALVPMPVRGGAGIALTRVGQRPPQG